MRAIRVLHCPWNIGGHAATLARFERACGIGSRAVQLRPDPYGFAADETLTTGATSAFGLEWARLRLLCRALGVDIVHFNFGQSCFMPETAPDPIGGFRHSLGRGLWQLYARALFMRDLPLLRAAGVRIVVTFQGDDVRPGDQRYVDWGLDAAYYEPRRDAWKRRAAARFARWADAIWTLNPDLLKVLPPGARFLPYATIDTATVGATVPPANPVPVIAHAPTHRGIKGTQHLLAAMERLRGEGIAVELDLIEAVPNDVARARYARADLVVDQLLLGWYGGVAVEMMALGKPVIARIDRADAARAAPEEMAADLPIIDADPETITDVLRIWLGPRRGELASLGARGRRYVERWHDPRRIAQTLVNDYARILGRAPEDALCAASLGS